MNLNFTVILAALLLPFLSAGNASAGTCSDCHASPPDDLGHALHSGLSELIPAYGDTSQVKNKGGATGAYGFNCGNCHPASGNAHQNGTIEISLKRLDSGLKRLNTPNARYDPAKKTCSGSYCHSSGGSVAIEYKESPSWEMKKRVVDRCQGCHGSPPSYSGTAGRHNAHFNRERGSGHLLGIHWDSVGGHTKESFRYDTASQMGCSTCHYETVREDLDTTFIDRVNDLFTCRKCHKKRNGEIYDHSLHVNGKVDISFPDRVFRSKAQLVRTPDGWKRVNGTGKPESCDETIAPLKEIVFDPGEKTCANVACHLSQKGLTWGSSVNCASCHARIKKVIH